MRFNYTASKPDGKIIEGNYDADSSSEVLAYLASQGLKPITLKVLKEFEKKGRFSIFKQSVNIADKIFLTKYLSLMLKVGTDLFKAIDILITDFDKQAVKALLLEIKLTLEKGQPFYSAFAKYPKIFSPVFINLIKAGEASGNLENIFEQLSDSLQKEQELRHRIKAALTYPILLLTASLAVLFLLISFALPKIAEVFSSAGFEPPTFSRITFAIGIFFGKYLMIIAPLIILTIGILWYFFSQTLIGRKIFYRFVIKLPAVGNVLKKLAFQRFASTLSALLLAGMPILSALEITADAVGSEEIKSSLIRIARDGISKGLTICDAFKREQVFPRVIVNLMAISEKAGHIEQILKTLADFYESEIDASIKTLVSFLEPVLLLFIGLTVGAIALAIIIPIYQLTGQF